ncbi:MAG: pyridoxal-phosphate dependent enzyme, partial [Actinomycetota bacterium]|nr:pyridoxal-phosphate dependent enzyme [Actinomycetota bacterium]
QGITRIVEDSSGNGGASLAAYAAAAGMDALILVPAGTSTTKVLQAQVHGAQVERIDGTREDVAYAVGLHLGDRFYAGHNWHPFFIEGTKLLAYEIWEDLGFTAPDSVVVPAGAGSLVLGLARGFEELRRAGQAVAVPRILVAQPENCSPLARAFAGVREEVSPAPTLAEGAAIARPVRGVEVLDAVRNSGGTVVAIPEGDIMPAVRRCAERGLYVEPTSALVVAALRPLRDGGHLRDGDVVVVVLTGFGAKASRSAHHALPRLLV